MKYLLIYYIVTLTYSMYKTLRRYNTSYLDGVTMTSPALDTIAVVLLCMILAPIDVFLSIKNRKE